MTDKFKNVPVEEDTRILFRQEAELGTYEVLYEMFSDLTDEELEQEVRTSPLISKESAVTIKCLDSGYTFVNILTNNKSFKPTCGIQAVKS